MKTYIFTNPQLPGLEAKVEAEHEQAAYKELNHKLDESIEWLRLELTELWEVTTSW